MNETLPRPTPFLNQDALARWLGRDTIGKVRVDGRPCLANLDTGATVNTVAPEYVVTHGLTVYPMEDLTGPLTNGGPLFDGVGGMQVRAKGYVVIRVQVDGVAGYDEDQVAIVFGKQSAFESRVPILLGTPTIERVVQVMKEDEIDKLATPWALARTSTLLRIKAARVSTARREGKVDPDDLDLAQDGVANRRLDPFTFEEVARVAKDVLLPPFSTTVAKAKVKTFFTKGRLHVTTTELGFEEGRLPIGVRLKAAYSEMKVGSQKVPVVLENTTAVAQILKAGAPVARVEAANLVPEKQIKPGLIEELDEELGIAPREPPVAMSPEERIRTLYEKLDLSGLDGWSPETARRARDLLENYHDIFSLEPNELGCTGLVEHVVTDETPIKERFRRIPPHMVEEVREHLRTMQEAGAISPSNSPWANAVVLVRKKDGGLRFCIDFRRLNDRTRKDSYPLPRIQESLEYLRGSRHFSSMDFLSGFWQVPMSPRSKKYTAFTVGNLGFFECERMPFGLCNAPATFQRLMQNCLGELNLTYCLIYLDDVIVYSATEEEHLTRLRAVFERFRQSNLKLKPTKCKFFQAEIVYLAHHVSREGIRPSQENLRAIAECPPPASYTAIRSFTNLAGHYRRFIKNFSKRARPLTNYLQGEGSSKKKEAVSLSKEAVAAFQDLKSALMTEPVLQLARFDKPFRLHTDASKQGLGAELTQKGEDGLWHPVAYGSRTLGKHEVNYHSSKLEFLALKWAITKQFKEYLAHAPFLVKTDNNPLTYVMSTPNLDATGHRWVSALAAFNFQIEYIKGSHNKVADALSRRGEDVALLGTEEVRAILDGVLTGSTDRAETHAPQVASAAAEQLRIMQVKYQKVPSTDWTEAQREDDVLRHTIEWVKKGKTSPLARELGGLAKEEEGAAFLRQQSSFVLVDEKLYVKHTPKGYTEAVLLFVVPTSYRQKAIDGCHRDAGHQGQQRTVSLLRERFWWPDMAARARKAVQGCHRCIVHEGDGGVAPLRSIVATSPLELMHVDYTTMERIAPLNEQPRVANVLVLTDHFTRFAVAYVTKDQKAKTVARCLYEDFIAVFGAPSRLMSDQGANFLSEVIRELCKLLAVQRCRTTPYHAQSNGQVERLHQTLMRMIGKLDKEKKSDWPNHLAEIVQAYNSTRSAVTGYSPFYLMFGRRPRLPLDFYFPTIRGRTGSKRVPEYVAAVHDHLHAAFEAARRSQDDEARRQKRWYDRRSGAATLKSGDVVLMRSDACVGKRKLKDKWGDSPYVVVGRIADDSPVYRVKGEDGREKVVHRNRLLLFTPVVDDDKADVSLCAGIRGVTIGPGHNPEAGPLKRDDESKPLVVNGPALIPGRPPTQGLRGWVLGEYRPYPWMDVGPSQKEEGYDEPVPAVTSGSAALGDEVD